MKSFEEKLQSFELREPPQELRSRVLANSVPDKVGGGRCAAGDQPTSRSFRGALVAMATSKWFLLAVVPLLTIASIGIGALSIEERGSYRRWDEVKQKVEAAGESLDYLAFFPAPVPDAQNFMATPALYRIEINDPNDPAQEAQHERINRGLPRLAFPKPAQADGEPLDFGRCLLISMDDATEKTPLAELGGRPEETLLQLCDVDAALFDELAVAARRPFSQPVTPIEQRLGGKTVWELRLGHLQVLQRLAMITSLRAVAAARLGDRELARDNLKIFFKCRDGVRSGGPLINGLVAIAMRAVLEARLPDLLREDCWTDADLAWLQERVSAGDGFEEGLQMFRCEMASMVRMYDELLQMPRRERMETYQRLCQVGDSRGVGFASAVAYLLPDGFYRRNQATSVDWNFRYNIVPLKSRDARAIREAPSELERTLASSSWFSFGSILAEMSVAATGRISERVVQSEMHRRMMGVAVGLERYRRVHGTFPDSLDALVPEFVAEVPEDLWAEAGAGVPVGYALQGDGYQLSATPILEGSETKPSRRLQIIR